MLYPTELRDLAGKPILANAPLMKDVSCIQFLSNMGVVAFWQPKAWVFRGTRHEPASFAGYPVKADKAAAFVFPAPDRQMR
jgi:hypothetical protein